MKISAAEPVTYTEKGLQVYAQKEGRGKGIQMKGCTMICAFEGTLLFANSQV